MRIFAKTVLVSSLSLISCVTLANTNTRLSQLEQQAKTLQQEIKALQNAQRHPRHKNSQANHPLLPITVTTSPLTGSHSAFDASDVIKQQGSINEDLTLLTNRQHYLQLLTKQGKSIDRPILELSGGLEGQILHNDDGFGGADSKDLGINLATAELDTQVIASNWVAGLFSMNYRNSPVSTGNRSAESDFYLARGYVTLGDLNQSPWYFTIGKEYVPFGQFSSAMINDGLTKTLGQILSTTASLGFNKNGLNIIGFSYSGSRTNNGSPVFSQGGLRVGYKLQHHGNQYAINASWVSNLADASGMQDNGVSDSGSFSGFANVNNGNKLAHAVAGGDISASATFGKITLGAEYLTAMRHFASTDLTFNGSAAKPSAMTVEADYAFNLMNKPATFALAYDQSWQAAALNMPKQSYLASLGVSWFKNTVAQLEYRHDINYSANQIQNSFGKGLPLPASKGDTRNSVMLQLGVYF